ncbi:hypothetical protein D3C80_1555240 [compost metagenome]
MTAGVHHRLSGVVEPGGDFAALVGQAGRFLDWQGIHVGAVHYHRSRAIAQNADHARGADGALDLKTLGFESLGDLGSGFFLLEGQFGIAVQLLELLDHLRFVLFDQGVDARVQVGGVCRKGGDAGKGKQALLGTRGHGVIPCTCRICCEAG